ncbi:hypothetical protein LH433_06025 [Laribacter hongkongensis]|uniref:autotransporter outer membrane beta-barrel domain-containing protein n=1 Tax=Laribacter hongkongensis TaxID=168471 RepID=UPI001EFD5044|nr:autotransporter outer membrane beta-barrel domain-containing protein [Laribacter hongkongensis]MCG9106310.1 hypothetical protein [Laribacter hongkongensis]
MHVRSGTPGAFNGRVKPVSLATFLALNAIVAGSNLAEASSICPSLLCGTASHIDASNAAIVVNSATNAVYGGYVDGVNMPSGISGPANATANNNVVTINTGAVASDNVTGGYGINNVDVTTNGNSVTVNGGTVNAGVFGGVAHGNKNNTANNNSVVIRGGIIDSDVVGGVADFNALTNTANGNSVTVSGGVMSTVAGAEANNAPQSIGNNNTVTITGGEFSNVYGAWIRANSSATANNNQVTISGGRFVGDQIVYGGAVEAPTSGEATATANGNTVLLDAPMPGESYAYAGYASAQFATANGNSITLGPNASPTETYGGYAVALNSAIGSASASNNTVTINGSHITGSVFGGFARAESIINTQAMATGNTVIIRGNPTFWSEAVVYGGDGYVNNPAPEITTSDFRTGNTLEIATSGITFKNIQNFQNLRFYLPATVKPNDTMLTLTDSGGVDIRTPSGQAPTTIGVGLIGDGTPLAKGDKVTLIKATGGLRTDSNLTNNTTGMAGISRLYTFGLGTTADSLVATVTDVVTASDPTSTIPPTAASKKLDAIVKSPAEGQAAAASMPLQGGDLASGKGMSQARMAVAASGLDAVNGFGAASGGSTSNKTGSHVDVHGYSLMAGYARHLPVVQGNAIAGVFFEAGDGNYSSFNDIPDGSTIRADGNTRYVGGGLLGRYDFAGQAVSGLYVEGTIRGGNLKSNYRSADLNPALGVARYDVSVPYWGAHIGVGKVWQIRKSDSMDIYGRYYWTRTGSSNVTLFGDAISFDAVTSQRARVGGRYEWGLTEMVRPFVDLAWEYEFDGHAYSVVAGNAVAAPSLKGGSGVGEVGVKLTPSARLPVSVDVGVQTWAGQRQGVTGAFKLNYVY